MKALRVWAISRKEFIHVARDSRSLGMAIAIPLLLLMLFGYALTLDVDDVPMVVWDQSGTPESRQFISRFDGSPYFSLVKYVRTYHEVEWAIDSGQSMVALIIPTDFARRIESDRVARIQLIVDGSDSNTATIAMGYADMITRAYSLDRAIRAIQRIGGRAIEQPIDLRHRAWFNAEMQSKNFIIPGLIAVIMMVIASLLTSLTVAREWETGTMEQLISTPVKPQELVLGKLIPYFTIGMLDVFLAVVMGEFLFHVPLRGSIALLFTMAAIFLAGALSVGMLISIVTRSQLLSSQLAMLVSYIPALLLSGLMFAINNMPRPLRLITYLVPARYFVSILKAIYLKGLGLEFFALEAGLLAMFGAVIMVLANVKFKKKLV
jgi:ABC-2 type transport system permease protein